jgi:hypothetical protein
LSARLAHLEQAKSNEKLSEHLIRAAQYNDWRCTAIYYAALHYIQAYFSGLTPPVVFNRHLLRDAAISEDHGIRRIWRDYRTLKDWSENARYDFVRPSVSDFSLEIVPSLIEIKRHLKRYVPDIEV